MTVVAVLVVAGSAVIDRVAIVVRIGSGAGGCDICGAAFCVVMAVVAAGEPVVMVVAGEGSMVVGAEVQPAANMAQARRMRRNGTITGLLDRGGGSLREGHTPSRVPVRFPR